MIAENKPFSRARMKTLPKGFTPSGKLPNRTKRRTTAGSLAALIGEKHHKNNRKLTRGRRSFRLIWNGHLLNGKPKSKNKTRHD